VLSHFTLSLRLLRYRKGRAPGGSNSGTADGAPNAGTRIVDAANPAARKQPTCKKCEELELGHARKRHPITKKIKKYPCGFNEAELDEMNLLATTSEIDENRF
jgi:hypothetical protein